MSANRLTAEDLHIFVRFCVVHEWAGDTEGCQADHTRSGHRGCATQGWADAGSSANGPGNGLDGRRLDVADQAAQGAVPQL
jgi:hypothetical protein